MERNQKLFAGVFISLIIVGAMGISFANSYYISGDKENDDIIIKIKESRIEIQEVRNKLNSIINEIKEIEAQRDNPPSCKELLEEWKMWNDFDYRIEYLKETEAYYTELIKEMESADKISGSRKWYK